MTVPAPCRALYATLPIAEFILDKKRFLKKKTNEWHITYNVSGKILFLFCHGPYQIPILYLEILWPVIRGGGKVENMCQFF